MNRAQNVLSSLVLVASVAGCAGESSREAGNPAYAWHDSVMAAMGGERAWERTRYLKFRWNVYRDGMLVSDRTHHWDRYDGDYRLEMMVGGGGAHGAEHPVTVLFNVNTREGEAFMGDERVADAMADSLVERAYAMFINDSYWLLMPYKWRDPGVELEYLGPETDEDGDWQVFHLAFEGVGLTPGDQYWVYVSDAAPHLVRKWRYHLESMDDRGPFIYWRDWQRFDDIMLATSRESATGGFRIEFTDIEASRRVPDGIFQPPAASSE